MITGILTEHSMLIIRKEGCHDCLDNLVSTLPKAKDYNTNN